MKTRYCVLDFLKSDPWLLSTTLILSVMWSHALAEEQVAAKPKIQKYPGTPVWSDAAEAEKAFPAFALIGEYVKESSALQVTTSDGSFYLSEYRGGFRSGMGWWPRRSRVDRWQ